MPIRPILNDNNASRPVEAEDDLQRRKRVRVRPAYPPESVDQVVEAQTAQAENRDSGYDVGYKKPPKHSQFKKGVSGNPKGRPRGAKSLNTIYRDLLTQKTTVRTSAGDKRVTRMEALSMKQVETAFKGNSRSNERVHAIYASLFPDVPDGQGVAAELTEADDAIIAYFTAKLRGENSGDEKDEPDEAL